MKSDSPVRYSIVVPFYNEQENIPPLYMKLTEVMDAIGEPYELVFVDDGSKDDSFKVLSEIYEHDRRVNLVRLRRNFGQTPALKAGFDFARGDVIISMSGDLQHNPEEIPRFLEKIEEGYDLVSGWLYQRRGHWLLGQAPSRVANWMMARLSGIELHDFGTTFKAYRREIFRKFSSTENCTVSFQRWRAPPAPRSRNCRSPMSRGKTTRKDTESRERSACFWIWSLSSFCWITRRVRGSFLAW